MPSALECEPGGFAEDYFRRIRGKNKCGGECGSGAHGRPRRWEVRDDGIPKITPATAHLLRCKTASEIRRCAGEYPGTVPQGWQRWADELLTPKVDWRRALAAEIRTGVASVAGCVDYSYMRPSRRASVTGNVVLPALRKPLPTVAVVIDTSGSMSEDLLCEVVGEVEGILSAVGVGADRIQVLSCDAEVHKVQRVSSARQVELFGGGGTNMGAGIDAALELRPRPSVVVVLTDGYTPWPPAAPKGARLVVGLVGSGDWPVPDWARLVRIEQEP
jgi:predicted metal-dependent peptidase